MEVEEDQEVAAELEELCDLMAAITTTPGGRTAALHHARYLYRDRPWEESGEVVRRRHLAGVTPLRALSPPLLLPLYSPHSPASPNTSDWEDEEGGGVPDNPEFSPQMGPYSPPGLIPWRTPQPWPSPTGSDASTLPWSPLRVPTSPGPNPSPASSAPSPSSSVSSLGYRPRHLAAED